MYTRARFSLADLSEPKSVALRDETDENEIGAQVINSLASGSNIILSFK